MPITSAKIKGIADALNTSGVPIPKEVTKALGNFDVSKYRNSLKNYNLKSVNEQIDKLGLSNINATLDKYGLSDLQSKINSLGFDKVKKELNNLGLSKVTSTLNALGLGDKSKQITDFIDKNIGDSNKLLKDQISKLGLDNIKGELGKLGINDIQDTINNLKGITDKLDVTNITDKLLGGKNNISGIDALAAAASLDTSFLGDFSNISSGVTDMFKTTGVSTSSLGIFDTNKATVPPVSAVDPTKPEKVQTTDTPFEIEEKHLIADRQSGAVSKLDDSSAQQKAGDFGSIFYGINYTTSDAVQSSTEQLLKWQEQVINDGTSIDNLKAPWDFRLIGTYTSTQSIGNSMPYGPEWVGSPSLMNKNALIRFDHVASTKHHTTLLDQSNSVGMRYGGPKTKYISVNKDEFLNNGGVDEDKLKNAYKNQLSGATNINVSENGMVSYKVEDKTKLRYVDKNGNEEIVDANSTYKPTDRAYWLLKEGWEQCGTDIVPVGFCKRETKDGKETSTPFVPPETSSADLKKWTDKSSKANFASELNKKIDKQIELGWKVDPNNKYAFDERFLSEEENITNDTSARKNTSGNLIETDPTTDNLCNANNWNGKEQFVYDYSDFLYCKYYGLIPNNHIITLRRFPVPIGDNARIPDQDKSNKFVMPVAKAVGHIGEDPGNDLKELSTFNVKMNWEKIEAQEQSLQGNEQDIGGAFSGGTGGFGKGLENLFIKVDMAKGVANGSGNFDRYSGYDEKRAKFDPYENGPYSNKVFGPVNVIFDTQKRKRGISFEQPIKVKFQYSLKSIGGINPKAALLDIMSNMLALTYNNAAFWGGGIRYFPNKPAFPMPGGKEGMNKYMSGNVTGFMDSAVGGLKSALGSIADTFMNLLTDPAKVLSTLSSGIGKTFMGMNARNKRPDILPMKAILTGEPVGEWHLVVGNPFNPILSIGNLIVTDAQFSFSNQLGIDDFPDELNVEVTLAHGRSRDKGDIESMFNRGGGRLHYSYYGTAEELWNSASSTRNSNIDRPPGAHDIHVNGGGPFTGTLYDFQGIKGAGGTVGGTKDETKAYSKMYSNINKQATRLASKMGFKSGYE